MQLTRTNKIGLTFLGIFLSIGLAVLVFLGYMSNLQQTGVAFERRLSVQYVDNQNELSTYISTFYEQVGIAQAQTDALDKILLDAVKGRYDKGGFSMGSPFYAAVTEAYPEVSAQQMLASWDKIQDYVMAGRAAYKNKQSKLLDMLGQYDIWRTSGLFQPVFIQMLNFPSNGLEARIGGKVVAVGDAARDKMYQIVLTEDAIAAYESGTMAPLQVPSLGK